MKDLYTNILPCLQTIGPWWTESDRRTLFCHLLKIFPFDAEYLSTLPAAIFLEDNDARHLTAIEIQSEYDFFCNSVGRTKCTCPNIRKLRFSFGKLNPKVCYLCPYSSSYKNQHLNYEYELVSIRLHNLDMELPFEVPEPDPNQESIFRSFFPIFINDILIDAQPISLLAHRILKKENIGISFAYQDYISYAYIMTKRDISQRLQYLRIKDHINQYYPDYQNELTASVDHFLNTFENHYCNTFKASTAMKEIFDQLLISQNKKYTPIDPSDFYSMDIQTFNSSLFDFQAHKCISNSSTEGSIDFNTTYHNTETSNAHVSDYVNQGFTLGSFINDDLCSRPTLDDTIISAMANNYYASPEQSGISVHTCFESGDQQRDNCTTHNTEFSLFKEFYEYHATEDVYFFGSEATDSNNTIFKAFIENSQYLCMEPVIHDESQKLLILSSSGDMMLYSIEQNGPKAIRLIADRSIKIYSSCAFYLNYYLIRNRIFKMKVFDVGLAYSFSKNSCIQGLSSFPGSTIEDYMHLYPSIYEEARSILSEDGKKQLLRFENYSSLLCSDGTSTPFKNLDKLYEGFELNNFKYTYTTDHKPIQSGIFHWIKVDSNNTNYPDNSFIMLYMDTCIALNKVCPFSEGHIYILNMSENGMLLYITGNQYTTQTIQQYLLSNIRRCFASLSIENEALVIQENIKDFRKENNS